MAGFNMFNQTTTSSTAFSTPGLNNTSAFGSTPNQQNLSFAASAPAGNSTFASTANVSGFGALKPQFGSTNTTITQANLSFGSNVATSSTPQTASTGLAKPAFGNLAFGSSPATQTGLSFGASNTPQTGLSFGTPATTQQQTGISFGTPTATTTPQAGLSFGSVPQTGISFGNAGTTAPTFVGAVQTVPTFGSASQTGTAFGSTPQQTSATFGNAAPACVTFSTTPQTSVSFGSAPQIGVSFDTAAATTAQTGLSFGVPASKSTAGLLPMPSLGATAPTTSGGLTLPFGSTSSTQPSLSFTTSTASQLGSGTLTLGTATTSTPSLFSGLSGTTTAPTSSAPGSFGGLSTAVPTTSTNAGAVFSWQKTSSDTSATSSTSIGLGGVYHSAVTTTQSTPNTMLSVKEQTLPNEIQQTVSSFKEYVKTQKRLGSEVARSSAEPLNKLSQQISALSNLILNLGSVSSQQKFTAEKVKVETIKSLNDYELAQKIKNCPVASEERMLAIRKYFMEKISAFEESTKMLQEKIEYVYQHVITLPQENSVTADALKLIVKKLHDTFVVIGARAYKLHNEMQLLKVQYLTLRNQYFNKSHSSIPFSLNKEFTLPVERRSKSDSFLEGPNPFSRTSNGTLNSILLTSQNRVFQNTASAGPAGGLLNTSKPFGFADLSGSSAFDQTNLSNLSTNQQFNLQKPPLGNKRGKR